MSPFAGPFALLTTPSSTHGVGRLAPTTVRPFGSVK
jgi:hypothetical protein